MKFIKIIPYIIIFVLFTISYSFLNESERNYATNILSYTKNESYIEYPQIENLKNKKKQNAINKLLKDQILFGAKNYLNEPIVNFSDTNYIYKLKSNVGLTNDSISSFYYSLSISPTAKGLKAGIMKNTNRIFGITIDMKTGKKIELSDFMIVDERLIYSTDGSGIETNYESPANPIYHNFKDAFKIYTFEEEKDIFHIFTPQEIINRLTEPNGETDWYIDENKNIVFFSDMIGVDIPYTEISELIYPKYLSKLEK